MNSIIIKHRQFEINEIISNNIFKCSFKNKSYIVHKLDINEDNYKDNLALITKLCHCAVKQTKLFLIDKKQGYVVKEYVEGQTLFDFIIDNDFNDNIYKKVFQNSFYARSAGLNLSFDLKSWLLVGDELLYIDLYCEKYNPNRDFTKGEIRKWFMSAELAEYYKNNGILIDKKRIKDVFSVNKEMVLLTCKYYM